MSVWPRICTNGPNVDRGPIRTDSPITQYGPIVAVESISACESMIAEGCIAMRGRLRRRSRNQDWRAGRRQPPDNADHTRPGADAARLTKTRVQTRWGIGLRHDSSRNDATPARRKAARGGETMRSRKVVSTKQ